MPIVPKRIGNQSLRSRPRQSIPQGNQYDPYISYSNYSKSASSNRHEQQPEQYYQTRATSKSASAPRT